MIISAKLQWRSFSNSVFTRVLGWLAHLVCRLPRAFIYPQILLAIAAMLYAAARLGFDMNRDNLIGPGMRSQQVYLAYQKEFPGEESDLVVAVQSGSAERNRQFIERLADRVKRAPRLFRDLFYKADLTTLGPKSLLMGSTTDLQELQRSLKEYRPLIEAFGQTTNLDSLFSLINRQFRNASSSTDQGTQALVQAVPFLQGIVSQAIQALARAGRPPPPPVEEFLADGNAAEQQIYVTVENGRVYLLTARPQDPVNPGPAIEHLRELIRATQVEVPGVDVGLTGGPVLDYDEMRLSEHDTTKASIVALCLCVGLFMLAYRQAARPLKAFLCLLIGLAYTMGFATLAIGHLNILTITFAPMLIGLAIDFGVHLISRFEEEMRNRHPVELALQRALIFTGQGVVTGGLTTAAAFLAMALTHFRGIREMGVISGCGLLLCLIPMMTTLPAMLLRGSQNRRDQELGPAGQTRLHIEYLWLRHPYVVIAATGVLCVVAAIRFHVLSFDYDLLHMQSQSLPSVVYEKKLLQSAGASSLYGAVIADSLEQARSYGEQLKKLPAVAEVRSAADFLGPQPAAKLNLVQRIRQELAGIRFPPVDRTPVNREALSATLWYLTGYLGIGAEAAQQDAPALATQLQSLREAIVQWRVVLLRAQPEALARLAEFQRAFFVRLRQMFQAIQNQQTSPELTARDLPPSIRDRFVGVTGKYLLQVYPRYDLWEHQNQHAFITEVESVVPANRVTGTPVQLYEYTTLLKRSYEVAAGYACAAIALMVFLHFRSLAAVLLALLPVALGAVWLLGFMAWTGLPFNPANIMILPLVLGIGVTNGVQILNRFAEEQQPSLFAKSTGKAVLVSGLTAIAGFGSLILANHQGIRSLGVVMSVGIASCMIAALTVLPALLRVLMHRDRCLSCTGRIQHALP